MKNTFLTSLTPRQLIKKWLAKNIGLPEILIFFRHILISLHSWIFSPFLIRNLDVYVAFLIMFISSVLISYLFIKISDRFRGDWFQVEGIKNGDEIKTKTILVKILLLFSKKKSRLRVLEFLFLVEPLIFALYHRAGHHRYDGIKTKKTSILFLLSSLFANILWASVIIVFNNFGIFPCVGIIAIFFASIFLIYKN